MFMLKINILQVTSLCPAALTQPYVLAKRILLHSVTETHLSIILDQHVINRGSLSLIAQNCQPSIATLRIVHFPPLHC